MTLTKQLEKCECGCEQGGAGAHTSRHRQPRCESDLLPLTVAVSENTINIGKHLIDTHKALAHRQAVHLWVLCHNESFRCAILAKISLAYNGGMER
jgi:hypothetical protein